MKTANEWYRKINSYTNPEQMNDVERSWVEKMINEARKEAIEECLILIDQTHTVRGLIEKYQSLINELK